MADPKNPFDFGTGSIDKDQWLRDIDAEQGDFVSQYSSAVNKHRAALMREAFADLRRRIANGDMLNRTADGLYQFSSALSREDKHMQEAYQRALGFMGDLARRQIQAPPAAEPEKKKYSTKTLNERFIKYFNPSGSQESFTSLWNSYDDAKRKEQILKFLRDELNNGLSNYQDVEDYESLDKLKERINEFLSDSNITNLNRLGFNRNYLNLLQTEEQLEETPKSEIDLLEEEIALQISDFTRKQNIENLRKQLVYALDANFSLNFPSFKLPEYSFEQDLSAHTPAWGSTEQTREQYYNLSVSDLSNYFSKLATDWRSIISQPGIILNDFLYNLSKLFSKTKDGQYPYLSVIDKLFSPTNDGRFLLKDTKEENDRRVFYNPTEKRFEVRSYNSLQVPSLKNGGILKFDEGGGFNFNEWDKQNNPQYYRNLESSNSIKKEEETSKLENSPREMTTADILAISADIGSIGASLVPGYGTAASAVLGVGSTLANFISDVNDSNTSLGDALWNGAKGLGADAIGLVPGFGAGAKGWKIATRLAKYGTSILAGLNTLDLALNSPEIMNSFKKVLSLKVGDMDLLDWRNIQNGLSMLATAGRAGHGYAVHRGYKNLLKPTTLKPLQTKALPKTKIEKAKAKLSEFRDKFKGDGETYDYGGPNTLPWYHDANIYLWGANRSGFGLGYNPYKVDMSTKLLKPRRKVTNKKGQSKKLQSKAESVEHKLLLPTDRGLVWNEQTHSYVRTKEIGGILKALRNGGIIKAQEGLKTKGLTNKYDNISDWTKLNFGVTEKLYFPGFMKARYDNRGNVLYPHSSFAEQEEGEHFGDLSTNSAFEAQLSYYLKDNGSHIFGDVLNAYNTWKSENNGTVQDFINYYNGEVDWLRSQGLKKLLSKANSGGWKEYNQRFNNLYGNYSSYDPKLEDIIGESTWQRTPNTFKGITDLADLRLGILGVGDGATLVAIDNQGHLIIDNLINPKGDIKETGKEAEKESSKATDSEGELKTVPETKYKNPNDPTPYIIAGKTAMGLLGNRNIYKNLLDEMPQAPLRDPIDRKLAIVGWQEAIKQGLNQLADLRNATWMQHGSNLLDNLAGMYETEGKGRDIMNGQYMKDSGRQFETAGKSWNLDNEDILYNLGVGDANRKSIADRARMMAQIRAAWRSGDNNIIMGALSDAGNWMMKNYQRESDLIDLVKQQQLGSREQFMENYVRNKHSDYDALKAKLADPNTSDTEKANIRNRIQQWHLDAIKEAPEQWGLKLYKNFHRYGFGGGPYTTIAKDGTKLEVAKLKARSKDNDRYVSMMKDLRTTRSRRRRR